MEIEQHVWGMTPEGEAVVLYILRNAAGSEVRLSTYGAAVIALLVPDREGRVSDVVLGYKQFDSYFGDPASCGKTLGRIAGRIAYGQMHIDGKEYHLEMNGGICHLNGGTKGFGNRLWEGRVETNRVVMSLTSESGDGGYPGTLDVEVVFDFDNDNTLEITYLARTDSTTVVNLASHIYFNLSGEASGDVQEHELQLHATQAPELDDCLIPTGQMLDVAETAQDFRQPRTLGDGIASDYNRIKIIGGYEHPFAIDGWQANILAPVGELRDHRSGRRMQLLTSQPCVVVDTANRIAGGCPETKSAGRYAAHAGVALMCQHFPDAVNHTEFPSPLLRPGDTYCQKTVYRFDTF